MEDGRGYSGIDSGKSIGLAEGIRLPAEAVESIRSRPRLKIEEKQTTPERASHDYDTGLALTWLQF